MAQEVVERIMATTFASRWTSTPKAIPRSDEDLLLCYRDQGDRGAFVELVHRYEKELYNYLRRYLGDAALAEDAFQMTFLQVHLKCDQFEKERRLRPWIYTIATNQAIDAQRRNKRHKAISIDRAAGAQDKDWSLGEVLTAAERGPEAAVESIERRDEVRSAVENLPEAHKQVVVLIYYQGLKYREAAEALGVPVGTVKSRLHAAIMRLNSVFGVAPSDEATPVDD